MVCKVGPPRANRAYILVPPRPSWAKSAAVQPAKMTPMKHLFLSRNIMLNELMCSVERRRPLLQRSSSNGKPRTSPTGTSDDMSQKDVIALVEDGTGEGGGADNVKDGNEMDVDDEGNAFAKVKQQMSKMGRPTNALKDDGAKAGAFFQHLIEKIRAKHDCWKRRLRRSALQLSKASMDSPSPEKKSATSRVNWAAGLVRKYTMGISRIDNEVNMVTFIFDTSPEEETGKSIPPVTVVSTDACLSAIESGDLPIKAWACDTKHIVKCGRQHIHPRSVLAAAADDDDVVEIVDNPRPAKKLKTSRVNDENQPLPTLKATPARAVPVASSLALKPTVATSSSASKPTAMASTSASKPAVAPSASVSKPTPTPQHLPQSPLPPPSNHHSPQGISIGSCGPESIRPVSLSALSASASKRVGNETVVKSKDCKDTVNDSVPIEVAELQAKGAEQRADKKEGSSMDVEGSKQSVEEGEDDNLMLKKDWDAMDPRVRMTAYGLKEYRKYEKCSSQAYHLSWLPRFNSASITPANMKALGSHLKHEDLIQGPIPQIRTVSVSLRGPKQKALQPGTLAYANIPLVMTDTGKVLLIACDVLNKAPMAFTEASAMITGQSTSDPPPPYSAFQPASRLLPYRGDLGPSQHKKMLRPVNQPRMPVKKPVTSSASAQALSLSRQPQHSVRYQRVAKVEPLYWDFDEAGWQDSLGWMDHGGDMDVDMDIFGPLA
ncbi:hypothetical protein CPB84DRAFT_1854712 [Gymnopilus junonius]|uniref:Uncharacterized protein n=1 Tax=Gymnopilus junonius TaxID=109634 RepID=A0A9P5N7G7_GYMJU|nr:hypothetical protein CPB84DRAFT_1854712 [Gymnopilus junonius]